MEKFMENPLLRPPGENMLRLAEVPGANLQNFANPAQRLLADAFPAVGKIKVEEEQRPLLLEEMLPDAAAAGVAALATGYGGRLLGTRSVSLGLSRIGADAATRTIGQLTTRSIGQTAELGIISSSRMTSMPSLRSAIGTAALISAGNYGLDQVMREADPDGKAWYSLNPTTSRPYTSTIFAPTMTESAGYGAACLARGLSGRARMGVVAGSWVVGRIANALEDKLWK